MPVPFNTMCNMTNVKRILLLTIGVMAMLRAWAVPAYPYPVTVTQPDGTTLTIQGHGDEHYHFTTTADGYTVMKNEAGYYVYAQMQDGRLAPSSRVARDEARRTEADRAFLRATGKMLLENAKSEDARKARRQVAHRASESYYKNFRGLVILINFLDKEFSRSDANSFYDHMFNDENYAGYTNEDGSYNAYGSMFIGGVRDYFRDNSMGKFAPQFDVVGPVTIDMNSTDIESTLYAPEAFWEAVVKLDDTVDFSKYDADGDGYVDMIYFIVAGYGANYSGNNGNYLWPHKSSLAYYDLPRYDGKRLGVYASSVELYGWESQRSNIIDGIGTVCHEFSHVLGLPDEYDTNYAEDGQSHDPGLWSVMAGGSYAQYGRLPVGYSAFERYASGFLTPKVIDKAGKYELPPLQSGNEALMLNTLTDNEFFLLENRQRTGWDRQLPGHGMLVFRVDSTNVGVWSSNRINANPDHNYYELLRAGGSTEGAQASDAFPGTANVTVLDNETSPSLRSWNGVKNLFALSGIAENDGVISFKANKEGDVARLVEDFETMGATSASGATGVRGRFCPWNFTKCGVVASADGSNADGKYSVAMKRPSAISTAEPLAVSPFMATVRFFNPTSTSAKFKMQYMIPADSVWVDLSPSDVTVAGGESQLATFLMPDLDAPAYFRVTQIAGSATAKAYADNITFVYYRQAGVQGDINEDGVVDVTDVTALINSILGTKNVQVSVADINGDGEVNVTDVTSLINLILQ